jgi:hypothetical protein
MLALAGIAPIDIQNVGKPDVDKCGCIEGEANDKKANQWARARR